MQDDGGACRQAATLRPARRDEAPDLARLGNMAGHDLPLFLWTRNAAPGQDPIEVGVARAARDDADFSWRNATVVDVAGRVAGAVVSYPTGDAPEPLDGLAPIVRALQSLENQALGTHYVNVLAVYPEFRRRGFARALLAETARRAGALPLSLIVEDTNAGARRLYDEFGFRPVAEVPMEKEDWPSDGNAWVLMIRPASQGFPSGTAGTTLAGGGF